jgi:DNA-binding CsgD family transcriptional regulator
MRLSAAQSKAVRDVEEICARDLDSRTLRRRVAARLSRLIYWDAACFGTFDPWTMLVTDDVADGIPPEIYAVAAHNEYLVDDVNKFVTLARSGRRVGILSRSAGEGLRTSHRLRAILPAFDARYEMRGACVADGQCWGGISVFRNGGSPDFSSDEAAFLREVSVPLAVGLRRTAHRPGAFIGVSAGQDGPGVLILGPHNDMLMANEVAGRWLEELTPASRGRGRELPFAVHQVAARALAHAGGPDGGPGRLPRAYARVRARSGRWLTLQGSLADGGLPHGPGVAVVIDAAPSSDIAQLLMLSHGLTSRERQVLQRVIAGESSAVIAAQLHISANTVQDHLKAIFAKVGVRSRGQLVAQLLCQHYLPSDG